MMQIISEKRCIIGEGPIWNDAEKRLYYTNGMGGNELCMYDLASKKLEVRALRCGAAAYAFTKKNELIVSRQDGVFILNEDDSVTPLYDTEKHKILYANDMKVGPDGRIYAGTQSGRRKGVSEKRDGKLFCIDKNGNVSVLIDGLSLSNGMEWSIDEKRFYHTDSDTGIIREYFFNKEYGEILFSGREVNVPGVDGFTIDRNGNLYVGCWDGGHIAVVNTDSMTVTEQIPVPTQIPTSCNFAGENMDTLAITTASYGADIKKDENAGFTFLMSMSVQGRKPYLFG